MNGKHAEKSDGSYRTLQGFADAAGKKHGLDTYYGTESPLDDYLMSALDGTGMFDGASDSVREQAVEKGVQNQIMTAYAIHELNSAIVKAQDGNFGTDGAQHAWDEGWAFYHGLDEYKSCSPYATGDKRAGNFATADADGTALANAAILQAMNDGLAALKAEDLEGATAARDDVVKNLVIIYSQATIRYAHKMNTDDTVEAAQTHQAEGYSFWRVIESTVAGSNPSSGDDCYNGVTMTVSSAGSDECAGYMYLTNYTMNDGDDICYNMFSHTVSGDNESVCDSYMYLENYTMQDGSTFTGCYNSQTHSTDENMSRDECEAFGYYVNYGATVYTGCYNMVSHATSEMSEAECGAFAYFAGFGTTGINGIYDLSSAPVAGTDYQAAVRAHLQPAWDMLGITAEDIGTLQ
jgi:hypothetical protein